MLTLERCSNPLFFIKTYLFVPLQGSKSISPLDKFARSDNCGSCCVIYSRSDPVSIPMSVYADNLIRDCTMSLSTFSLGGVKVPSMSNSTMGLFVTGLYPLF